MGIFNLFKKNKTAEVKHIDLDDYITTLDGVTVDLSKGTNIDFNALTSEVELILDSSGSMSYDYLNGNVQTVINKLLPLALKFDDNGKLECTLFSNYYKELEPCTLDNYKKYVKNAILNKTSITGGTYYAPVLKFLRTRINSQIPKFVIFITDGNNSDGHATDDILRMMSKDNCFILFIGIGDADFNYLHKLDNLSGREVDNTGFIQFDDIKSIDGAELYTKALTEYSNWLKR